MACFSSWRNVQYGLTTELIYMLKSIRCPIQSDHLVSMVCLYIIFISLYFCRCLLNGLMFSLYRVDVALPISLATDRYFCQQCISTVQKFRCSNGECGEFCVYAKTPTIFSDVIRSSGLTEIKVALGYVKQNMYYRIVLNVDTGLLELESFRYFSVINAIYTIASEETQMITSSNGNIFRVTGHLCGEFTGHWWIPRTKVSDARGALMFPLICTWINSWANDREAWFEAPSLTSWHQRNAPAQNTADSKFVLGIRWGNNNENVVTIWSKFSHTYLSPLVLHNTSMLHRRSIYWLFEMASQYWYSFQLVGHKYRIASITCPTNCYK